MKRPLTGFEKAFCLSDPPVPMNFSMVVRFSVAPDIPSLRFALKKLALRYSMATLRLFTDRDGKAFFTDEGVPSFPLSVIEGSSSVTWQEVVAAELGKLFDLEIGPFVRMTLLVHADGSGDLILLLHHGIADGMSAVFLLQDLLVLLDDPDAELESIPETPDILSRLAINVQNSFMVKMQVMGMKVGLRMMKVLNQLGLGFPAADRLIDGKPSWEHIELTTRCLTPEETKALAVKCKENETSVHAAISAAWLRARNELIGDSKKWKRKISTPVNLRGNLETGNAFGMIMSNVVTSVDCSPDWDFWDIARELKTLILADIHSGKVYQWVAQMSAMMTFPNHLVKLMIPSFASQPPAYDFSMSNLGRLKLPNAENISAVYGPIVNTSEKEFTVGVSTIHNRLTMSFIYRDFVLSKEMGEKMADHATELLGEAAGW